MGFKRGVFHSFFHKQALVFHRHYVELDVKRSDVLSHYIHIMLTYQPECDTRTRVAWYGGDSTQLHFQHRGHTERWIDIETRTLPFIPGGVKDLYEEMRDFYNYCYGETSVLDQDNLIGTIF